VAAAPVGAGKGAHHVEQRVRAPELLGVEGRALALGDAGEVHHLERGGGGLLRGEELHQAIHPRVGHARHAHVHLAAGGAEGGGGHALAGEEVEERGLSALGKPEEPDLHEI
jgi:hypothetical protein